MINNQKIFVVMPAYNEAAHIADVIGRVPAIVDKIIVVDDNSSDNTRQIAEDCCDVRVEVISNAATSGVGGATIAGYRRALEEGADVVVKVDADGQMNPAGIGKLVSVIVEGRADYAKGFRFHDRQELRKMPRIRLIGNLGLSYLVKMASGYWNIFDPTNGFTAIGRTALDQIALDKLSCDYYFETDMLCRLYRIGAVVKDVSHVVHYGDEQSHLSTAKTLFQFPGKLLKSYIKRIIWQYYISDFSTFSILFFVGWLLLLFGVIFGSITWYVNASRAMATPTGTVMLAVVPLFLGFQMLLQATLLDVNNVHQEPLQKST